jgi:hypothetical protein
VVEILEDQLAVSRTAIPGVDAPGAERAARRALREQIARLEGQLARTLADAWPRHGIDVTVPAVAGGPRLLALHELEALRDAMAGRLLAAREQLAARHAAEAERRVFLEAMLARPRAYKWAIVRNVDIGEPGCRSYRSVPRLGPVGMLAGWWHVKVSSGCPLPAGR